MRFCCPPKMHSERIACDLRVPASANTGQAGSRVSRANKRLRFDQIVPKGSHGPLLPWLGLFLKNPNDLGKKHVDFVGEIHLCPGRQALCLANGLVEVHVGNVAGRTL